MTPHRPPHDPTHAEGHDDHGDQIARVLKFAGSRPQPDAERKAAFKNALHAEWRRAIEAARLAETARLAEPLPNAEANHAEPPCAGSRAEWRSFGKAVTKRPVAALAAGIAGITAIAAVWLIAVLLPSRGTQPAPTTEIVGRVVRSEGVVRKIEAGAADAATNPASPSAARVNAGEDVRAGVILDTGEAGRMALALGRDVSLRMDVDSRIVLIGERVVRLQRGAVYVDARAVHAGKRGTLLIHTPHGDVRDIGTQFEVRARGASFGVRVREGEVLINRGDRGDRGGSGSGAHITQMTARAGEGLHLDRDGRFVRTTIPIFGPEWAWTSAIAPQFQLEGSTVRQFLDWVTREQGWRWRFADADTGRRAAGIVTHGSLDGYTPEEALAIVLPTCGLSFVRNGDEVVVRFVKGF